MKLKFEFAAELPLKQSRTDIIAMTALFPRPGQRATAFGWGGGGMPKEYYWLAEIGREGVSHRRLPESLTDRLVELSRRQGGTAGAHMYVQAFKFGEGVGLLLGTQEVHLYPTIQDEPQVLVIEQGFSSPGVPPARSHDQWFPQQCGHSVGNRVPVVLFQRNGGQGEGRHLSLLELDPMAGRACWRLTDPVGIPYGTHYPSTLGLANSTPLILDAAWIDEHWLLYVGGFSRAYYRFGLAPSMLSRNQPDLSLQARLFTASEDSFGRICASQDRLILTPLRKNGPGKGKQSIYRFDLDQEITPVLPRGYSKHSIVEYHDGCYWLLPMPWGYEFQPLVACSEV